ncbi:MAG: adenylate/guanylate cyclase domain-containing protein, partial [Marinobacterium sp.]
EPGMPALQLSVGINSGVVVVGEFGSSHRRSYTLLGAPVNLAAHLEGATRKTDFPILVGSGTHALMPHYDWPDAIQLKLSSREHPVTAWPLHANESPAA